MTWAERVNRERGRELEFEEILGYHLEQAYRYRVDLGVIDDEARGVARPRRGEARRPPAGARSPAATCPPRRTSSRRATALLPELDPLRVELLLDLAEARIELGELEAAGRGGRRGPRRRRAARRRAPAGPGVARPGRAPDLRSGPDRRAAARTTRPIVTRSTSLEAARRPRRPGARLARARRCSAHAPADTTTWPRAAERLIEHATRGRRGTPRRARRVRLCQPGGLELPARRASSTTRIEGFLERIHGDRKAEANIALALAQLHAMQGEFDRARELYRRGQALLRDLGPSISAITTSIASARVELLAGDLDCRRGRAPARRGGARRARRALLPALDRRRARPGPPARRTSSTRPSGSRGSPRRSPIRRTPIRRCCGAPSGAGSSRVRGEVERALRTERGGGRADRARRRT